MNSKSQESHPRNPDPLSAAIREAVRGAIRDAVDAGELPGGETVKRRAHPIPEAAAALGVSEPTLRALIRRGLPTLRLTPTTSRVVLEDALAWLREHPAPERQESEAAE